MKLNLFLVPALVTMFFVSSAQAMSASALTLAHESYALEAKRDYNGAIAKMVKVLDENKSDYYTNFRLGWLFTLVKKYENTTEHYEAAGKAMPESLEPWLALSILNLNLGNYEKLLASSEEILKRAPTNYYGLQRGTTACIKLKKYDLGLTKVNKALEMYPLDTIFLEQKGYILTQMNKASEAKPSLELLQLISPMNAYANSILKK